MIYKNDNIKETSEYVKGTIKDLKEYFRYEIASLCMTGSTCDYEMFRDTVANILELLDNLYEETNNNILTDSDIIIVKQHPMDGYIIEKEND